MQTRKANLVKAYKNARWYSLQHCNQRQRRGNEQNFPCISTLSSRLGSPFLLASFLSDLRCIAAHPFQSNRKGISRAMTTHRILLENAIYPVFHQMDAEKKKQNVDEDHRSGRDESKQKKSVLCEGAVRRTAAWQCTSIQIYFLAF